MKKLIILVSLLVSLSASAITFEITKLCEDEPFFEQEITVLNVTNVLEYTAYHLKDNLIPHQITENGILSILDTPTGYDAYEFISENHMRVYGWCYEIDGTQPNVIASEYQLDPETQSHLRWFYGYAEVVEGVWLHYCRPVHETKAPFICN